MQVKTYTAETLPLALFKAKQELGNDIVILESKQIKGQGFPQNPMIEVTVGLNPKNVKKWQPPKVDSAGEPVKKTYPNLSAKKEKNATAPPAKAEKNKKPANTFDNMISDILNRKPQELDKEKSILNEIALMRKELNELSRKSEEKPQPPEYAGQFPDAYREIEEMLKDCGVQEDMAYSFVNQAYLLNEGKRGTTREAIIELIKSDMEQMLQPFDFDKQLKSRKQKVILLVGPTGAGKSTVAMKLAAHPEIYGEKKVTIISTDPYGPSEALKAYSRMSGTHVHEEKDIDQTEALLEKYKSSDVLIVDTPGKSPFAPNQLEKLEQYIKVLKPSDIFLVLSVGSDLKDLVLLCANYLLLKPSGIAFSKFDETTQPGKVYSILDVISLPVVCFGDGKRVFVDIAKGDPQYMHDKIFDTPKRKTE